MSGKRYRKGCTKAVRRTAGVSTRAVPGCRHVAGLAWGTTRMQVRASCMRARRRTAERTGLVRKRQCARAGSGAVPTRGRVAGPPVLRQEVLVVCVCGVAAAAQVHGVLQPVRKAGHRGGVVEVALGLGGGEEGRAGELASGNTLTEKALWGGGNSCGRAGQQHAPVQHSPATRRDTWSAGGAAVRRWEGRGGSEEEGRGCGGASGWHRSACIRWTVYGRSSRASGRGRREGGDLAAGMQSTGAHWWRGRRGYHVACAPW